MFCSPLQSNFLPKLFHILLFSTGKKKLNFHILNSPIFGFCPGGLSTTNDNDTNDDTARKLLVEQIILIPQWAAWKCNTWLTMHADLLTCSSHNKTPDLLTCSSHNKTPSQVNFHCFFGKLRYACYRVESVDNIQCTKDNVKLIFFARHHE